jgi:hypothetical protein
METAPVRLTARGKPVALSKHAAQALGNERPKIHEWDVIHVLEEPDEDDPENGARKRIGRRTIIVRYEDLGEEIFVRTVSATRSA